MNIENIKTLRNFLITVPETNFDHGSWLDIIWNYDTRDSTFEVRDENLCATTACIGGWCAISQNLLPYTVDDKGYVSMENWDLAGIEAQKWLELNESEAAILFWPFDVDQDYKFGIDIDDTVLVNLSEGGYLGSDTTVKESVAFLDKVIENGKFDLTWWKDVKSARIDAEEDASDLS